MSCPALPEGWKREETKRSGGLSSGKIDICYISPSGTRIKSKAELAQNLGNVVYLTTFYFRTGKIIAALVRKNKRPGRTGLYDYRSLKHDQSLTLPVRQSPWIFKRPVKYVSTQPNSLVYNSQQIKDYYKKNNMTVLIESKSDAAEKPHQLFWQKRLQGLRASINGVDEFQSFKLPSNMKAFMDSLADQDTLVRSVTASLHQSAQPIRGQEKNALHKKKESIEEGGRHSPRNPVAFINPHQPLIVSTTVTEEDICRQEKAVADARQKLQSAIQDLHF